MSKDPHMRPYEFVVETMADASGAEGHAIRACYFKDDERFVMFKNAFHETVFAVRTDLVTSIERRLLDE
jgi:hypothetical protein